MIDIKKLQQKFAQNNAKPFENPEHIKNSAIAEVELKILNDPKNFSCRRKVTYQRNLNPFNGRRLCLKTYTETYLSLEDILQQNLAFCAKHNLKIRNINRYTIYRALTNGNITVKDIIVNAEAKILQAVDDPRLDLFEEHDPEEIIKQLTNIIDERIKEFCRPIGQPNLNSLSLHSLDYWHLISPQWHLDDDDTYTLCIGPNLLDPNHKKGDDN